MTSWIVVEDEPDIYEMVLAMYSTLGVDGVPFVGGEDAVGWIDDVDAGKVAGDLPELALLDIRLPGQINGAQVGARIRQSPKLGDIAIVLMTAYKLTASEEAEIKRMTECDLLLYKPLPALTEFRNILQGILDNR